MEENNLIFGIRAVMEALKAGKEIDKILIKKKPARRVGARVVCRCKGNE